jgi:glutamate mutase epsilon subunit
MELRNKKWTEQEFLEERRKVLATWKTGSDPLLDLDTAVKYLKSIPFLFFSFYNENT